MTSARATHRKPAITVSQTDYDKLVRLADTFMERNPNAAESLMGELDRARVVADQKLGKDIVRMGSILSYVTDTGEQRRISLVYPGEADISQGKISILTPIGAAVIGLSPGQSIDWKARDGRTHRLTVETVESALEGQGLQA